jgi:ATP-dependent exoDNAse (exonuclease V) beta subunit
MAPSQLPNVAGAPTAPSRLNEPSEALSFDPEHHRYTYALGDALPTLTSVTTLIEHFSHWFDAEHHAARIAERDGKNTQDILDGWAATAAEARERGALVHETAENGIHSIARRSIVSLQVPQHCEKAKRQVHAVARWFANHPELSLGWTLTEHRVCWPARGIAGTIDLLTSNYEGSPAIIDFKTNREIDVLGYRNMLPPFRAGRLKLPDANWYHYCLQLNIYRTILAARYDYDVDYLALIHIDHAGNLMEYPVPLMPRHVDAMLDKACPANLTAAALDEYDTVTGLD